jgi:gamma-tubulin complex component 2
VPPSENSKLTSFGSNHHYLECIKAAYNFASGELVNLIKEKVILNGLPLNSAYSLILLQ